MIKKGMIRFRRKLATLLAAAVFFSSYPLPAYATGENKTTAEEAEVISEEAVPVCEEPGLNAPVAAELYVSDIDDGVLEAAFMWYNYSFISAETVDHNGFTIYDDTPIPEEWKNNKILGGTFPNSGNKIRVYKNTDSIDIPIASASRGTTNAYLEFGEDTEHTGISFTAAEESKVAIVAGSTTNGSKLYFKEGEGAAREETVANLNDSEPSAVFFKVEAGKKCSISADPGVRIYFVKLLPPELYVSDIAEVVLEDTQNGYKVLSAETVSCNGYTIYDTAADSDKKIRVYKNTDSIDIPIASASRGITDAYLEFGEDTEHTGISFTTAEDSEVAIVAESTADNRKVYFKAGDVEYSEKVVYYRNPSTVLFKAEKGKNCRIYGDPGVRIYFVQLMPKSNKKVWNFADESLYGQLTDKSIAYAIGYIDGMIVDCTYSAPLHYVKGSSEGRSYAKVHGDGEWGTKMYVPVYDEYSVVRISAAEYWDGVFVKVNGEEAAFTGEREFKCVEGDRPGYLTLEFGHKWRPDSNISKIEILPAKRVTFMASDEEIGEAAFSERLSSDSIDMALAVERAVDSAPEGKVFAGWSAEENGEKIDFKTAVFENNTTLYAVYEDASEVSGELYFDELTDDGRLKYRFATVNGFTVYDTTDSNNAIRINDCEEQSTCVSSASRKTESKVCFWNYGGCIFDDEGAFVSFKPAVDSEIVAVVNRTGVEMGVSDGREIDESDRYDLESKGDKPSLEILEAKANSLCKIRLVGDDEVYFVKIMPKSGKSTWDFTGEDPFGVFGDEISGTMAWVSGLYADTTIEGAKLVKYDTQEEREAKGINLTQGSIIYVPIRANGSLFTDAPIGYSNIEVDGKALTAVKTDIAFTDTEPGKTRLVKIEAKNGDADIKKIEVVVTKEKTDVTLTAPVAKTGLKESATAMELVSGGSVTGGTLYYALGRDDKTAPTGDWKTDIPTAKEAGTYYVWYKVEGDEDHYGRDAVCITVVISKEGGSDPVNPDPVNPTPVTPDPKPVTPEAEISNVMHAVNVETGAVAKNGKGETVDTARENEVISIEWTKRDDRDFVKWKLNGATPQDPVSANTVFKMGSTDVTVAFEEKLKADAEVTEALPETYDTSVKVKKLKFESSKLTLKKSDKATKNAATPEAEGTAPEVVYVTENRDIVAVDKSGNFYPMGAGEATVTAYCGNKTAKCKVTVVSYTTDIAVRDVTAAVVNDTTIEMKGGEQAFLNVSFEPYDSTDPRNIKWRSDNKKVTVKNGIITAKEVKEAVTAVVTASVKATGAEGGVITKKVTIHVTPEEVPAAANSDKTHTLSLKKSVKMVTTKDSNKTELAINIKAKKGADISPVKLISVKSTNPEVISANIAEQIITEGNKGSGKAVISANKAGTAYIIVTTSSDDGKSVNVKRCKVTVSSPATGIKVESGSLAVTDNKISMRKGTNGTVEVKLDPGFSTDLGKLKISGSKGIKVKNGIIYATKVSKENKPAKLTVRCGKLKKEIEVTVSR